MEAKEAKIIFLFVFLFGLFFSPLISYAFTCQEDDFDCHFQNNMLDYYYWDISHKEPIAALRGSTVVLQWHFYQKKGSSVYKIEVSKALLYGQEIVLNYGECGQVGPTGSPGVCSVSATIPAGMPIGDQVLIVFFKATPLSGGGASFISADFVRSAIVNVVSSSIASGDTNPPVVSNVYPEDILAKKAQIKWSTNEPSSSAVVYGKTPGYYNYFSNSSCGALGYIKDHCIELSGLDYNTAYYYKVESVDVAGNITESSEHSFVSGSGGSPPEPPSLSEPTMGGANVYLEWVDNSSTETEFKLYRREQGGFWQFVTSVASGVSVYTDSSLDDKVYEYKVGACNVYGCSYSDIKSVVVGSAGHSTIFNIGHSDITDAEITITWETDKPLTSKARYGLSTYYENSTPEDFELVTDHSVTVTGLSRDTTYIYKVVSGGAGMPYVLSGVYHFTTLKEAPPVEEDVPEEDVPEEDVPEEDVPEEDVPEEDVPEEDVPEEDVPEEEAEEEVIEEESEISADEPAPMEQRKLLTPSDLPVEVLMGVEVERQSMARRMLFYVIDFFKRILGL